MLEDRNLFLIHVYTVYRLNQFICQSTKKGFFVGQVIQLYFLSCSNDSMKNWLFAVVLLFRSDNRMRNSFGMGWGSPCLIHMFDGFFGTMNMTGKTNTVYTEIPPFWKQIMACCIMLHRSLHKSLNLRSESDLQFRNKLHTFDGPMWRLRQS